jgi:ribosomal subunit interface protein
MKINIKGTNLKLTPDIYSYVEERLHRVRKYIADAGESVQVGVDLMRRKGQKTGDVYYAELQFSLPYLKRGLRTEEVGETWRSAFDEARNEMKRRLQEYKERKY